MAPPTVILADMSFGVIGALFVVPVALVMAAIVAIAIWAVVRASRTPGGQPVAPGSSAAMGSGQWNAHVRRDGHLDPFNGFGTVTLNAGVLSFTPKGASVPAWSGPSVSFGVWPNSVVARSDLTIDSQLTGRLGLTISHGRVEVNPGNTFGMVAERGAANEFVQAMRAAGATIMA